MIRKLKSEKMNFLRQKLSFILLFIFLVFSACRKENNYLSLTTTQNDHEIVERFLKLPKNATSELKSIVADIRREENRSPFLNKFIAENGTPKWEYTISPNTLFSSPNSNQVSTTAETNNEDISAPIYFIPLTDSVSGEVKSFLYCAKSGDSTYQYHVYNKSNILKSNPGNDKAYLNAITSLAILSAFENSINNKKDISYPAPFNGIKFNEARLKFQSKVVDNNKKDDSFSRVKTNYDGSGCIVNHFTTILEIQILDFTIALGVWTQEDICAGTTTIMGYYIPSGFGGGGSSSPSSGNPGSYDPGGSFGGFIGGYIGSGGSFIDDPTLGTGSGVGGPYIPNDPNIPFYGVIDPATYGQIPILDEPWYDSDTQILENVTGDEVPANPPADDQQPITFSVDADPWPTISPVIPITQFVAFNGDRKACLLLSIQQIGVLGLHDLSSARIIQAYTTANGVNVTATKEGINYIISKLKIGHAVIVGVDNHPGSGNVDATTDHFITIVGCGVEGGRSYFRFYDPATKSVAAGTSIYNKLFYDPVTNIICGTSSTGYANSPGMHPYILAMIRKNK